MPTLALMVASLRTQEYERLRPTFTHYAIAKLVEDGVVRHVITQVTTRPSPEMPSRQLRIFRRLF